MDYTSAMDIGWQPPPVEMTFPEPLTAAQKVATLERALIASKTIPFEFDFHKGSDADTTYDVTQSTEYLGWKWDVRMTFGKRTEPCRGNPFILSRTITATPSGVVDEHRGQTAFELYAKTKFFEVGNGVRKEIQKSSTHVETARYLFFYPRGDINPMSVSQEDIFAEMSPRVRPALSLDDEFHEVYKKTILKRMETMDIVCHTTLFDIRHIRVLDLSRPPPVPSSLDCTLICGIDERPIYCNSRLLALGSAYFSKALFEADFEEKKNNRIVLPDVSFDDMYDVVTVLHKQTSPITDKNVASRLALADRLEALFLSQQCENHLINVSQFVLARKMELALTYRLHRLFRFLVDEMGQQSMNTQLIELRQTPAWDMLDDRQKAIMFERLAIPIEPKKRYRSNFDDHFEELKRFYWSNRMADGNGCCSNGHPLRAQKRENDAFQACDEDHGNVF